MPKNARCCVGGCDNDERCPCKFKIRSNAGTMKFFKFAKHTKKRPIWIEDIKKGRENLSPGSETFVCANHFIDGEPTPQNPKPTLFLTPTENRYGHTPTKIKRSERRFVLQGMDMEQSKAEKNPPDNEHLQQDLDNKQSEELGNTPKTEHSLTGGPLKPDYVFEEVIRDGTVWYTSTLHGLPNTESFKFLFLQLRPKANNMNYWKGEAQVQKEKQSLNRSGRPAYVLGVFDDAGIALPTFKSSPKRKLDLDDELLLTLMKLRLGLHVDDLAFRFEISRALVSEIFST
jgi:hypothetical protein